MKRLWRYKVFFLLAFLFLTGITSGQEQKVIKRWVKGTVVATDIKAIPNTIVVSTINWKGQDLTVGAQVLSDTEVIIDGKPARLLKIVVGDKVSMVYLREPTRLVAKRIEVTRQK